MKPIEPNAFGDGSELEQRVGTQWRDVSVEAARSRFGPASVSALARVSSDADADEALGTLPPKEREGRWGNVFGSVVHQAIGLVLRNERVTVRDAVECAAKLFDLTEHLEEAVADVTQGLGALGADGVGGSLGPKLQLEYPVAGQWTGGRLVNGYIDLVSVKDDRVNVIDFKTDTPPPGPVEQTYPQYAAQVRIYGKLLEAAGILKDRPLHCGLLFTMDGVIRWVGAEAEKNGQAVPNHPAI
jgi:hypothetical protein